MQQEIPSQGFCGYIVQTADDIFLSPHPAVDGQFGHGQLYQANGPDEPIPAHVPQDKNLVAFLRPKAGGGVCLDRLINFDGLVQVPPDDCLGVLCISERRGLEMRYCGKFKVCYYGDPAWEAEHAREAKATA